MRTQSGAQHPKACDVSPAKMSRVQCCSLSSANRGHLESPLLIFPTTKRIGQRRAATQVTPPSDADNGGPHVAPRRDQHHSSHGTLFENKTATTGSARFHLRYEDHSCPWYARDASLGLRVHVPPGSACRTIRNRAHSSRGRG